MEKEDIKKLTEIILRLVARNMEAGLSYNRAKDAAFNRMEKEHPELFNVYLNSL